MLDFPLTHSLPTSVQLKQAGGITAWGRKSGKRPPSFVRNVKNDATSSLESDVTMHSQFPIFKTDAL